MHPMANELPSLQCGILEVSEILAYQNGLKFDQPLGDHCAAVRQSNVCAVYPLHQGVFSLSNP